MPRRTANQQVVPQSRQALNAMKYEIAAELGLMTFDAINANVEMAGELGMTAGSITQGTVQWPQLATRDAGSVGGLITRRLIQQAQQTLSGLQ